jgi:hypothetical protein
MKSLIVFDLDGRLAESKSAIHDEMGTLLTALLGAVSAIKQQRDGVLSAMHTPVRRQI